MSYYGNSDLLTQSWSPFFTRKYGSGHFVAYEGIYLCAGCTKQVALRVGEAFPDFSDHAHAAHAEDGWIPVATCLPPGMI